MTDEEPWRQNLLRAKSGVPKPILANAIIALRDSPTWQGVLSYDVFAMETIIETHPPWANTLGWEPRAWSSNDDILVTSWLQHAEITVTVPTAAQAVEAVARESSFHPVQEYLASLQHDLQPRAESWLSTHLGVEPTRYSRAIGRAMLIGAVARILDPGCKHDTVPIFEGEQGLLKSTAIKALFSPWFTDEIEDFGSKDAAMQMRGMWGIEISELDAMSRAEASKTKAFISRTADRFRPPYGQRVIESPRTCVFWGTTNTETYLKDDTGGRRFWPIKVGKSLDIDGLREARDQLWAEAVVLYQANLPWWITKDEIRGDAEQEQRDRYVEDPWSEAVQRFVRVRTEVSVTEILREGLGLEITRLDQLAMNRVSRILRSMGYRRRQRGTGPDKRWVYTLPGSVVPEGAAPVFHAVAGQDFSIDDADFGNVTSMHPRF